MPSLAPGNDIHSIDELLSVGEPLDDDSVDGTSYQASSGNSQVPLNQQVQVGMTLGSAISPAVFLLTLYLENQVDSTTEGSQGDSTAAASVLTSIEADTVLGSTIATTTSYMSAVDVALLEEDQVPRIVEYELEIPFCELDDPPDMSTAEAASRCERENER